MFAIGRAVQTAPLLIELVDNHRRDTAYAGPRLLRLVKPGNLKKSRAC